MKRMFLPARPSAYGKETLDAMLADEVYGTFKVVTFGCQMNARDSEKLTAILEQIGYREAENEDADFVLYNTCTVRENANLKVYGRLGQLGARKKKHPEMLIGLCGCMMQEPEVVKKLKTSYRFVDLVFGTHNIFQLAELNRPPLYGKKDAGGSMGRHGSDRGKSPGGPEVLL